MTVLRIDYVNGHDEWDGSLWFFDGKYVGHDDQIGETDFATKRGSRLIDFHHRHIRAGTDPEDVIYARSLAEIEEYLNKEES
jgi:hypothetical protein